VEQAFLTRSTHQDNLNTYYKTSQYLYSKSYSTDKSVLLPDDN